jgi:hypothetical protein
MTTTANWISFDPLDYDENAAHAKLERDAKYRELRKQGIKCRRSVLRGQLRPYASFGVPDGRVRDVYYVNIG